MTLFLRGYGMRLFLQGGTKRHSYSFPRIGFNKMKSENKGTNWVKNEHI